VTAAPATTVPAKVNINTATAAQLDELPGVGPSTAKQIISYRQSKGPFSKVEDLLNVPGIGPAKLDAMRQMVTV
jgi:competence protein ComEA